MMLNEEMYYHMSSSTNFEFKISAKQAEIFPSIIKERYSRRKSETVPQINHTTAVFSSF